MKSGSKSCPFCASRFTFEDFELVDSMPAESPCDGCIRLYAILAESARRKATLRSNEQPEAVELTPASILARLQAGRPKAKVYDFARAAANDLSGDEQ